MRLTAQLHGVFADPESMRTAAATRRRRILRAASATVFAGAVFLGFALHQLVLSDLRQRWAQDDLGTAWRDRHPSTTGVTTTSVGTPTSTPAPDAGAPVARLRAAAIGLDQVVLEDVDLAVLRSGPGHFPTSALPGGHGNVAIAGHRTTYGAPFRRLDELQVGDEIVLEGPAGARAYRVAAPETVFAGHLDQLVATAGGHAVVRPDAVWITDPTQDDRVTLVACHPKGSARQRIVVVATRPRDDDVTTGSSSTTTTTPTTAPPRPTPDRTDQLLDDRDASTGRAVAWGGLLVLIWAASEDLRRRMPAVSAIAIAAVATAVAAWPFYAALEVLLPAW